MALNLDAVGKRIGPYTKEYSWKDPVLYALGVGAGFDELAYCYEKDLKVLPSFGIITLYDFMPDLAAATEEPYRWACQPLEGTREIYGRGNAADLIVACLADARP